MQDVAAAVSNQTWNDYFNTKLKDKIGMTGLWTNLDNLNVYWSNTRSMARFRLMIYARGTWGNTQIVSESFLNEATTTSQNIHQSYGYLWCKNGKSSYYLPKTQIEINGTADMYAALGKNDQKIYVMPSKKLVIVRMGEVADGANFALSDFDNTLWGKINDLID